MDKSVGGNDYNMWNKCERMNYNEGVIIYPFISIVAVTKKEVHLPQLMLIAYQIKTGLREKLTEEFNNRTVSAGDGIKVMLS